MKKQEQEGFTLIELMIVIAIIGILAAIAIPQFQAYQNRKSQENKQVMTVEQVMLEYVIGNHPNLNEWTKPKCRKRDVRLGYPKVCTISGRNKLGEYKIIAAECVAGKGYIDNEGCNPLVSGINSN